MKNLLFTLTLLFAFTFAHAQSDIKARIEFEEAEKAFVAEEYEMALKHLNETEKLIGKWTPTVAYLKIEALHAITDMGNFGDPTMQALYEEVTKYMTYMNKLNSNNIPTEKYKAVYAIEKVLKAYKLDERQSPEFIKAKKEHDNKNYDTALSLYDKLVTKNNSWAMRNIGLIYEEKKDFDKAKQWYLKAVENGNPSAALGLSTVDRENRKAWREKSAIMGHPNAVAIQGWEADSEDENYQKARDYYEKAADLGSAYANVRLGYHYKKGLGVEKDYKKAFEYYQKAAKKGNSDGLVGIGLLYHNGGNGITQNHRIAMEWYLKAVEKKNTDAMYLIGRIYQNGQGEYIKDYKKAEEWYQKRIDNGDKVGYLDLGDLYSLTVNSNPQKALENYEKAADSYLRGMLETANFYYTGKGKTTKDYAKAAKYYEEYYETKKKNEAYLDNLIDIYNRGGHGIEKDKEKAKYWKNIRRN
ncbi:tetratricopeptide repeat protein [Kaistella sp.]|uniref:tetratricopeptide repeat protein n=1 Tax=Kaistella sp. TaxID=2782235 RepID=UPI003C52306D